MTRQWWIGCAIVLAALVAAALALPHFASFILVVGTTAVAGASLVRWRPALGWVVGGFGLLFGMGILLPGMAKVKQAGYVADALWGMSLGGMIILCGLALLAYRIRMTVARPA